MITIENLSLRRGDFFLNSISLTVQEGECLVIMGPSGAGKTLLVETILGFHTPLTGRVFVCGEDVTQMPPERRGFSYVPQDLALFSHLSVHDNIAFALCGSMSQRAKEARVREVAAALGIGHLLRRYSIAGLSGGERQRLALARALARMPRVLFLDEPLSSVDLALRRDLYRELRNLRRQACLTTVFVTHDLEEAFAVGERVAVMVGGRLEQVGPLADVYSSPRTQAVARQMCVENLFFAEVLGPSESGPWYRYRVWLEESQPPVEIEGPTPPMGEIRGPLFIGIRAEHVQYRPLGSSTHLRDISPSYTPLEWGPGGIRLRGRVRLIQRLPGGSVSEIELYGISGRIVARARDTGSLCTEGEDVLIEVAQEHIIVGG